MKRFASDAYRQLKKQPIYQQLRTRYQNARTQRLADEITPRLVDLQHMCLFIGHGRSGHSIIGALLDAHPDIVMPDEIDLLHYLESGFSRGQLAALLVDSAETQVEQGRAKKGRDGKTYAGSIDGQWQGRSRRLHVLGSSKAGVSTAHLERNPALLTQLETTMGVPTKIIHVVRNPFDNIATMSIRTHRTLPECTDHYFRNCQRLSRFRARVDGTTLLTMQHEELIDNPAQALAGLCDFLEVSAEKSYIAACASIIYRSPAQSRSKVEWSAKVKAEIGRQIDAFEFLAGYGFE